MVGGSGGGEFCGWRGGPTCSPVGGVAQLVEQLVCNQQAAGSSPVTSTTTLSDLQRFPCLMGALAIRSLPEANVDVRTPYLNWENP